MALAAGARFGPYEIIAPLGAGGMGEVYRAKDTRLDRIVAIKVLPEHLGDSPELHARFEREARAISSLNHPHICALYDIGQQDGVDYLVMEYLDGETLAHRIARGPIPAPECLRYFVQIADALDKAHRQGLVHRDLKPANVMLTKAGAKLLDFGLARAMDPSAGFGPGSGAEGMSRTPTLTRALTTEGAIVGTFQYMAPEQLEGREADARCDLWAFGATLHEALTGQKAFAGQSQASLIASILKEQPRPLAELQPLAPPEVQRVIERCLAKDPDDRWQSARDMAHELRWITEGGSRSGVAAPVAARRRPRDRATLALAVAGLLGTLGFAAAYVFRPVERPDIVRFEVQPPSYLQFVDAPRISPDGRTLAFSATDSLGATRIYVRPLSSLDVQPLPGSEGVISRPFWSPDSRQLAFFAAGKLKKIDVGGGPAVTICDAPTGADGSWGRGGFILFDGRANDPIYKVSAAGGTPTPAVSGDSTSGTQVGWPAFLPDGKHFLYVTIGGTQMLSVGQLDSKKTRDLAPTESRVEYTDDGYIVFARGPSVMAQRFDARSLKLRGEAVPIADPVRRSPSGGADFSVSQRGTLVYAAGGILEGQLAWVDRNGREEAKIGPVGNLLNPFLSPDGRRVAYRVQDPISRARDVWLLDMVRGVTTRFTFGATNENNPVWSPDGSRIAYASDAAGSPGIYVKHASGAGDEELLLASADGVPYDWAHDGSIILYGTAGATTGFDVWALPLTGDRKPVPFLRGRFNEGQAKLSPDGRYVAYISDESTQSEVYVQTYPDPRGKWQISTGGALDPQWRGDGRELYYLGNDQRMMAVSIQTTPSFEAGIPMPLFTARVAVPGAGPRNHYVPAPDGKRFLLVSAGGNAETRSRMVLNWPEALKQR